MTDTIKKAKQPGLSDGRQEPSKSENINQSLQLGVSGVKISSGFVYDEYNRNLTGDRGRRTYRQMRDDDATVGAILFAIEMLLRAVKWRVEPYNDSDDTAFGTTEGVEGTESIIEPGPNEARAINTSEEAVLFLQGVLFDDMDGTWDDFITNVLTMLTFGWQYSEIVWKRRLGDNNTQTGYSSVFSDGLIGIAKLADRSQETIDRWDINEVGILYGMWQRPPEGGALRYIPLEKALHFKPHPFKDSPEGKSVLRAAYRPWYFLKNTQEIEAIAIERELTGLPVVSIPNSVLNGTDDVSKQAVAKYTQMVRDVKYNEQGGLVLPSDTYFDSEGNPTTVKQVEFSLVTSGGSRAIDTDKVIKRYQGDIARTILADFIMLGQGDRGSFALSKNKIDLFLRAGEGWLESIAATLNRSLIPKIWKTNGLDPTIMPHIVPGKIAPDDLEELGDYVKKLSDSGIPMVDEATVDYLREVGGFPVSPSGEATEPVTFPPDDKGDTATQTQGQGDE